MKKYIIWFLWLILFSFFNVSYAATIANNILIKWVVSEDTTWKWYGWKLVFPNDTINWTKILTNTYNLASWTWDFWITGWFWLQNLSSTTNSSYWWVTFDIGNVYFSWTSWPLVPKVIIKNIWSNNFRFEWYAWSNASGWIYFWNTGITNGSVIYNRTTWKINWCAWSQNLWWICINNIDLDTTPPDISSSVWLNFSKPIAANNSISLSTPELISKIEVENWNNLSRTTYLTSGNFNHDFRKAKDYSFVATDEFWNTSDVWTIKVVSNIPSTILSTDNIWVTSATTFSKSSWNKLWDWKDKHNINFTLKDTYWNLVVNEAWIKNVSVNIWLNNNVDRDQILNLDLWNAIVYSNNPFWLISWLINTWNWYKSDANYNLDISSYAPTKSWYSYTTINNDISISNLKVKVDALMWNTWVWETLSSWIDYSSQFIWNFSFIPSVEVTSLTNSRNFNLLRDIESTFNSTVNISKTSWSQNIEDLKVQHKLDVINSWTIRNFNLSFQDISSTTWAQECIWYLRPNADNTSYISYSTSPLCDPNTASNIRINNIWPYITSQSLSNWFKSTPKVVRPLLSNFDIRYSSIIEYKIWWSINVKYPSLVRNYLNSLTNNQIKVSWIAHWSDNNFWVTTEWNIDFIWKLSKNEILTNIRKNVEKYKILWDWKSVNWVLYKSTNYSLTSWPSWINTIIVDGADLFIWWDILKVPWEVKAIIVLKKDDWTKWDIFIKDNVKFIWSTIVTQKSIISWDWSSYYSDTWTANNQLFIKWSLISYNTIWWSSSSIPKCPYYVSPPCDYLIAKRYDLNNFRAFNISTWNPVDGSIYWVDMSVSWYDSSSMIIEYDSEIQLKTPEVFIIK